MSMFMKIRMVSNCALSQYASHQVYSPFTHILMHAYVHMCSHVYSLRVERVDTKEREAMEIYLRWKLACKEAEPLLVLSR